MRDDAGFKMEPTPVSSGNPFLARYQVSLRTRLPCYEALAMRQKENHRFYEGSIFPHTAQAGTPFSEPATPAVAGSVS
ncbi:MAG TPA: hypothetical protein PKO06_22215, partial [Candidatus Ozemobacteraceae bacterium]|nr:hypothetical protein [Candidatus Ozemobacteraceae bacterium]